MARDLRDTRFVRRHQEVAAWVLFVLSAFSAAIGVLGLVDPVTALLQGRGLAWTAVKGPIVVLLVSLICWLATLGARRENRRRNALRPLDEA